MVEDSGQRYFRQGMKGAGKIYQSNNDNVLERLFVLISLAVFEGVEESDGR